MSPMTPELQQKLNEIASEYILTQNFQNMIRLADANYCDNLVIITSKILKENYNTTELQQFGGIFRYSKFLKTKA